MPVNVNLLPQIRLARSEKKPDEDDETIARLEDDFEDMNKTLAKTSKANPNGVAVRCAPSGEVAYNDNQHQIVIDPATGQITVLDRETAGSENLIPNFTVQDGFVYHRNPAYDPNATKWPANSEFLKTEVPKEGMELILSGGTTMFLTRNDDGTMDMQVVNIDSTAAANTQEQNAGVLCSFTGIGSGEPFKPGANASGGATDGKSFLERWEATHDAGGKGGKVTKVWVTPMTQETTAQANGGAHREQGKKSGGWDKGQGAGGFSLRSDGRWDEHYYFWDIASHNPVQTKNKEVTYAGTTAVAATDPNIQFLLAAEDKPLFANPNNPAHEGIEPIYGEPVSNSDDSEDDSTDSTSSGSSPSPRSRTMSLTDYLGGLSYESLTNRREERGESY